MPKPTNLIDHAESKCAYKCFEPKKPEIDIGTANKMQIANVFTFLKYSEN